MAAGSQLAFKVWQLSAPLKKLAWVLLALGLIVILLLLGATWGHELIPSRTVGWAVGKLAYLVVPILLGYFVNRWLLRVVLYRETLRRILMGVILSVVGWAIAWFHLWIFDWLFLRQAKITAPPRPARPLSEAGDGSVQP